MKKRAISVLLVLMMAMTLLPFGVFAKSMPTISYRGENYAEYPCGSVIEFEFMIYPVYSYEQYHIFIYRGSDPSAGTLVGTSEEEIHNDSIAGRKLTVTLNTANYRP